MGTDRRSSSKAGRVCAPAGCRYACILVSGIIKATMFVLHIYVYCGICSV